MRVLPVPARAYIAIFLVLTIGLGLYLLGPARSRVDGTQFLLQDAEESFLRGDDERALALYRQAREADPASLDGHLGEAGILTTHRRFAQATSVLRSAIPLAGLDPDAWCALGRAFRDARATDEAMRALSRALELEPGRDRVRVELGDLYRRLGESRQAEACYRLAGRALKEDPGRLVGLGRLQADMGKADSAALYFLAALRLRPHDPDLLSDYAEVLMETGGHQGAIEVLQRALDQDAHHLRSRYLIVRANRAAGQSEAAIQHMEAFRRHRKLMDQVDRLEAAVAEFPTAEDYQMLSHLYTRIGRDSLAARRLMRATCLNPMVTVPQEMEGASTY